MKKSPNPNENPKMDGRDAESTDARVKSVEARSESTGARVESMEVRSESSDVPSHSPDAPSDPGQPLNPSPNASTPPSPPPDEPIAPADLAKMRDALQSGADAMGIPLDAAQLDQFDAYTRLLLDWNRRMNLTRITEPLEIVTRHYLDSLTLLTVPGALTANAAAIDVGSGAGFPGIPLAIARPDTRWTLMDSLGKRVSFLQAVVDALGLRATAVHARAEFAAHDRDYREKYDLATARAVSAMPTLTEILLPFVGVGGKIAAYRGKDAQADLEVSRAAIHVLGGGNGECLPVNLPSADFSHHILLVTKRTKTRDLYPRRPSAPEKNPILAGFHP